MGFWNERAICPNCGAKIHTQPGGLFSQKSGKQCPQCGVALTGKVNFFTNKATLTQSPVLGPKPSSLTKDQRLERLERLVRLKEAGAISEEEFEAEKRELASETVVELRLIEAPKGSWKQGNLIKEIRELRGLGLREAKDLVDQAPSVILSGVKRAEAEAAQQAIEESGATTEVRSV